MMGLTTEPTSQSYFKCMIRLKIYKALGVYSKCLVNVNCSLPGNALMCVGSVLHNFSGKDKLSAQDCRDIQTFPLHLTQYPH